MGRLQKSQEGFGAVEAVLVLVIVILIVIVGWMVYKNHHKVTPANNTAKTLTTSTQVNASTNQQPAQKYVTISVWSVRVPYSGVDTLSVASQTCAENGDASGDTVNLGCQVPVNSRDLANSVGSCQSTKATGTVGYFYRMGSNDNYSATNGSGYTPVAQWAAQNPGQYTKIGNYYYAFAPIGAAWGGSGADSIKTSTNALADTIPAGCDNWMTEYNNVEPTIKAMASKFEVVQ